MTRAQEARRVAVATMLAAGGTLAAAAVTAQAPPEAIDGYVEAHAYYVGHEKEFAPPAHQITPRQTSSASYQGSLEGQKKRQLAGPVSDGDHWKVPSKFVVPDGAE